MIEEKKEPAPNDVIGVEGMRIEGGKVRIKLLANETMNYDLGLTPRAAAEVATALLFGADELPQSELEIEPVMIVHGRADLGLTDGGVGHLLCLKLNGVPLGLRMSWQNLVSLRDQLSERIKSLN